MPEIAIWAKAPFIPIEENINAFTYNVKKTVQDIKTITDDSNEMKKRFETTPFQPKKKEHSYLEAMKNYERQKEYLALSLVMTTLSGLLGTFLYYSLKPVPSFLPLQKNIKTFADKAIYDFQKEYLQEKTEEWSLKGKAPQLSFSARRRYFSYHPCFSLHSIPSIDKEEIPPFFNEEEKKKLLTLSSSLFTNAHAKKLFENEKYEKKIQTIEKALPKIKKKGRYKHLSMKQMKKFTVGKTFDVEWELNPNIMRKGYVSVL